MTNREADRIDSAFWRLELVHVDAGGIWATKRKERWEEINPASGAEVSSTLSGHCLQQVREAGLLRW